MATVLAHHLGLSDERLTPGEKIFSVVFKQAIAHLLVDRKLSKNYIMQLENDLRNAIAPLLEHPTPSPTKSASPVQEEIPRETPQPEVAEAWQYEPSYHPNQV